VSPVQVAPSAQRPAISRSPGHPIESSHAMTYNISRQHTKLQAAGELTGEGAGSVVDLGRICEFRGVRIANGSTYNRIEAAIEASEMRHDDSLTWFTHTIRTVIQDGYERAVSADAVTSDGDPSSVSRHVALRWHITTSVL
jgi:hypothetical protein